MEYLEAIRVWLMGFDQWGDAELAVDITGAAPTDCGLFPLGMEVLETKEDLLGNRKLRLRQSYLLRRMGCRDAGSAAWLLLLQQWIAKKAHTAPVFGTNQTVRGEKGRLLSAAQTGLGIYEVRLIFEYEMEE